MQAYELKYPLGEKEVRLWDLPEQGPNHLSIRVSVMMVNEKEKEEKVRGIPLIWEQIIAIQ